MAMSSVNDFLEDRGVDLELESETLARNCKFKKEDVEKLLAINSKRISYKEKVNPKSNVWMSFKLIYIDDKFVGFVRCNECLNMYTWESGGSTKSMLRHDCDKTTQSVKIRPQTSSGKGKSNDISITKYLKKTIPQAAIHQLNIDIAGGLCKDIRPLHSVEGDGFKHYAQALLDFGAKYGSHPIEDIIQHRTTLKRYRVPEICDQSRKDLKNELKEASTNPIFAFTSDMWTDKYKHRKFLSLSIHWISDDWNLKVKLLGLQELEESATSVNIGINCEKLLSKYFPLIEIPAILENSYGVTDGGGNIKKVFQKRLPCKCHQLNLYVEWLFNDDPIPTEDKIAKLKKKGKHVPPKKMFNLSQKCPKIKCIFTSVKSLVKYFKQSDLNSKLDYTLKQDVCVRWNTQLIMLESYLKSMNGVKELLEERGELYRIEDIDEKLLRELCEFLKPFQECSESLSGDTYPTIHLVAPWFHKLRNHINIQQGDSTEMKILKRHGAALVDEYLAIEDIYYGATMLDPRFRTLRFIHADETASKERVKELFKTWVDSINISIPIDISTSEERQPTQTPKEKSRSRFSEFMDNVPEPVVDVYELDAYMNFRYVPEDETSKKKNLSFV